MVLGMRGLFF
jgi:hypothetical protein